MHYLALSPGFLCYTIKTLILAYLASVLVLAASQGVFPRLENVGAFRKVSTVPTHATCGFPGPSTFCRSPVAAEHVQLCTERLCIQDCPYRSASPLYTALLEGLRSCIPADDGDLHPYSRSSSVSFMFGSHQNCPSLRAPRLAAELTLAVWLKLEQGGTMCVIEKTVDGQIVFKVTISEKETMFYYRTVNGLQPPIKVMTPGRILMKKWIHLTVQVHQTAISFFVDGLEENSTAFDTRTLHDSVTDSVSSVIQVGQSLNGSEQFVGRMQDFRLYNVSLTNREILEVFSGDFPHLHIQPHCRCPGSHPRVHPSVQQYCIPNGAGDTPEHRMSRLNPEAHPLSFINDDDVATSWISHVFTNITQLYEGVAISIDLENGQYQVLKVITQFSSLQPVAIRIQRKKADSSPWEDWQYFARNCSVWGMKDNEDLENPNSVNCLQLPDFIPFSHGNVTFDLLTSGQKHRPGYNDFYNSSVLQEFMRATQIRLHFHGQYYPAGHTVDWRHQYYAVDEIIVSGRCQCHGHAETCDRTRRPYRCLCSPHSFTEGPQCDRCSPLYNDKPFRSGDNVNAFNCKPCQCHGHASSCHYDASVDPFPLEHNRGGGGVCDDCQHHTTGRHCESCQDYFYRPVGADPAAPDACKLCDCNRAGTRNGSLHCDPIGGQCDCKRRVSGRQCLQCQDGFYDLQALDPDGCRPCNCNPSGTVDGDITCHQNSGQCSCKANVIGLRCNRCNFGFKFLQSFNGDGCEPCQCNLHGSVNQLCDPLSGQCACKKEAKGLKCDSCRENFYGLPWSACEVCDCSKAGSQPGTVCDTETGQCVCKPNVGGRQCSQCKAGYFNLYQNDSHLCLTCNCEKMGTVNGSLRCDKSTGQCPCKLGVTGLRCHQCKPHRFNLTMDNPQGCQACDCDSLGTLPGSMCDPISGQCLCLPHRQGRRCEQCQPGFYSSPSNATGCLPCLCHTAGAVSHICNSVTGQCSCHDPSTTGRSCHQCQESYFRFDPLTGRCRPCHCHVAGASNGTCDAVTGQCFCKEFVTGSKCDTCVPGASHLDVNNLLGCSKTPSQQPPPRGWVQSSSTINVSWSPPECPNAHWLTYTLFRNGSEIYTTEDEHPYYTQYFLDTSLSPHTAYSYYIETSNVHSSTRSIPVIYETKPEVSEGHLNLTHIIPVGSDSITLTWTGLSNSSDPVAKYVLSCTPVDSTEPCVSYEGPETSATIWNLVPFTQYCFSVQGCTNESCFYSLPIIVTTAQAPPQTQGPPTVWKISPTELRIEWSPPVDSNGIIISYELYMRRWLSTEESLVFESHGLVSSHSALQSVNPSKNLLQQPQASTFISGLEPHTEYAFRVLAVNMAGRVSSAWASERTGESVPVFMAPPSVSPLSPHSLSVSWEKPAENFTRGEIIGYKISMVSEHFPLHDVPVMCSKMVHFAKSQDQSYIVRGLEPYRTYSFTVSLCDSVGCVTSALGSGQTLAAAPAQLRPPMVTGVNSTTVHIRWLPPAGVNGPPPLYHLERKKSSLPAATAAVTKGTRFVGHGYCRFPRTAHADFIGIKASFRTRVPEGLILLALSPGDQEEYFTLQLKNGRPYFLYNSQGTLVEVTPTDDPSQGYRDGEWHEIIAVRHQAFGQITLDGQYTGSSSSLNGSSVTGGYTGLFVGGVPQGHSVLQKRLEIIQRGFVGCLKDVFIMKGYSPSGTWLPLDWQSSEEQVNVHPSWEGCPTNLEEGVQFLGAGFLELPSDTFHAAKDFEISLKFQTDQLNGLLLFIHNTEGPDFLAVELKRGLLSFKFNSSLVFTRVDLRLGLADCDGKWNTVSIKKEGSVVSVRVNALKKSTSQAGGQPLLVNSPVYLGGIPRELQDAYRHLTLEPGFRGCVKEVAFARGVVVNLASVSSRAVRVNQDGCLSSDSTVNCGGNDSILVYRGSQQSVYESGLQPFTEYLYRVTASHEGGAVSSDWSRGRTLGTAPQSVPTPSRAQSINGSSVEVAWNEPAVVKGVLEKYVLKAYSEDSSQPRVPSASTELHDTSTHSGVLIGLHPFHSYTVTLTACSRAGCTESSQALSISTPQEAPQEVQAPVAVALPNSLSFFWSLPRQANGIITQYSLYVDGRLVYTGKGQNYTVTDLRVFAAYEIIVGACTQAGCTNSSQVILHTAQLPPEQVDPPGLTVLDSRTIHVRWKQPRQLNGILERYILYILNPIHNSTMWSVVYNSTEKLQAHVLHHLSPGGLYLIRLRVCTGGGCTTSEPSQALMEETIPEGVPAPRAHSYSPDSFNISWTEPEYPNGVITTYELYLDDTLIHNSSGLSCHAYGFDPGSLHTFQVQACTAKGCALGPLVGNRTLEAPPEGVVNVLVKPEGSREAHVRWDAPAHPNGRLTYSVHFTGSFYADQAGDNYTLLSGTKTIRGIEGSRLWVLVDGLVPCSHYMVQVNASNSRGSVLSDPVSVEMPPGAPDGLLSPRLAAAAPTSLQVVWSTPARNNAPGSPRYQLQMRPGPSTHGRLELFPIPSASLSYEVTGLQPFTVYEFRLVATNGFGTAYSAWTPLMTTEDKPGPIDAPILINVKARMLSVIWRQPAKCNGAITHYNIYLHGRLYLTVSGRVTNYTVVPLHPYKAYHFQVEACTSQGCSKSPSSETVWTLPGNPEGIPSPQLFPYTPTSIIVTWQPSAHLDLLVENVTIERRVKGKKEVRNLVTLARSQAMKFIDNDPALRPWTRYEYRVLGSTLDGGTNSSAWVEVTTRPCRPSGVQPPTVRVLAPDTVEVSWKAPLMQNGDILSYEIRMPEPLIKMTNMSSIMLSHLVKHLIPFTNYSVTIVACSGGNGYLAGCTESPPTLATTHPAPPQELAPLSVILLSESDVGISWQPPSKPNGPNLRYELLRCKIQQPLASNPPEDLNLWHNIYSGTRWFYKDKGLSRFTTYEYKLFVHNSVGFTPSREVTVTTLAGSPERGATVTASILNHTAIDVRWKKPTFQDLQGDVEYYTLFWSSGTSEESLKIFPDVDFHVIGQLSPNVEYQVFLLVFNGVHAINSTVVHVTMWEEEPQGMLPPEVVIINSTAVRVIWTSPSNPNAVVTESSVYVNNKLYKTGTDAPGSFVLEDLSPFTIYDIQVEVCTKDACVKSNGTQVSTAEDTPSDISIPVIRGITSRSLQIDWTTPANPNGIILGYDVLRKTWRPCSETQKLTDKPRDELCKAVKCQYPGKVCGHTCYSPGTKVCCDGLLYDPQPGYSCCEDKYIALSPNATGVCCGGRMWEAQPDHQCCSGHYARILPGEICCPDERHNRVSVGFGDACCGTMPYATSGSQVCCAGRLQDGYRQQCCGGEMVSQDFQCCGGGEEGMVYSYLPGMLCCGQDYVNMSETICCSASSGESKAHVRKDDPTPVKCCGTELSPESQRCCDGVGYNPLKYVCSDEISAGMAMKETRVCATICPATMKATAHCGRCDFNATTHICTVMRGPLNPTGKKAVEGLCSAAEEIVHSGDVNTHSFIDRDLKPSTVYEYRISAWNSYGRGFSQSVRASTREDVPEGVKAPRWARTGKHEDVIFLQWEEPMQSNGPIIHYILFRDGRERFQGTALSFTDTQGIQPLQEYSYQLKACTAAGCAVSCKVVAATTQRSPENVPPPNITAQSSETLHLSWSVPEKMKDAIKAYQLWLDGKGLIYTDTSDRRQHTVTGLQPYTNYSFTLAVCTSVGCTSSEPCVGQTLQAAPQGVWVTPRHIIINSTTVELYWNPPERPNGLISQYQLRRNGSLLLVGGRDNQSFTDSNLEPGSRYIYKLEARTGGGSSWSEDYLVQMPLWTPEDIHPPCNVTVLGSDSIFVAWPTPGNLLPKIPVEYSILLSGGSVTLLVFSVRHRQSAHLKNLSPFTQYEIRIQACQNGGCGVSPGTYVRTLEAAPVGLMPPLLKALGSSCIEVKWMPPTRPNGIITSYVVHRRPADTEEESLLFVWSEGALEFTDDTGTLRPFTLYEYRVRAWNSQGAVDSPWSTIQTLEAPPRGLPAPRVQATSAHSAMLNWTEPEAPNGLISQYHVIYQERPDAAAPGSSTVHAFTVTGTSRQAHLFGLEPFTTYHIGVVAVNSAGKVSSPWTLIKTLESAPSGLMNFTVEQREKGRALLLQWSEPVKTNGVIKAYNIFNDGVLEYSGLGRQFLFRRLAPFTLYTLILEACTTAGCAHSVPQPLWTEEAPPDTQMAPTIQSVGPTNVRLHWSQPASPNGKIIHYEVIRRRSEEEDWGNTTWQADGNTVFTEYNTQGNAWVYNDTGLQPWRQYAYRICAWNSAGHTCSSWNVVRTLQAPPDGLSPPEISYVSMSPLQLLISWLPPRHSNGVIQGYRLQRDGVLPALNFNASTFSYMDSQLLPFSTYSYAILACTGGGCCTSEPTNITTPEVPPSEVSPPVLWDISAHQMNVSWSPPSIPNGKIVKYLLQCDGEEHLAGQGLSFLLSNLQPSTQYNISLVACTSGGCTASRTTSAWTKEAPPENMDPPTLHITGPESIEITWTPPRNPHGLIRSYELRRDGAIVYVGLETRYHDFTLAPGVEYSYSVTATNSRGSVLSPLVKGQTSPSAPSGLQPPKLHSGDALELLADWDPPVRTNGKIINYTLFVREMFEGKTRAMSINTTHSSFGTRSLTVKHLKPFHRYEVRVQACTALGCTSSEWTSTQTSEVPPLRQPAPHLEVQTATGGFQPIVAVWWAGPLQPNGKIICFELYRRQVAAWPGTSSSLLIYNGSFRSFMDSELLPFTEYEYQVWAVNSAGKAASNWTRCRTGPAPPEGLQAPTFHTVSSTRAVVNISVPSRPNGNISLFRVFSNSSGTHVTLSEGTATQQTLHDLSPFTTYTIGVEACTCFNCCSRGPTAELRTHPAPPSGLSPPQVQTLGSRMASVHWTPPLLPNGVIHSYELQLQRACPPDSAPRCPPSHTERKYWGPGHRASLAGLQPNTAYGVQVVAYNEAGSTASGWTNFSTKKEMPQYQALFSVDSNASMVWVDWSGTFLLNGHLKEYVVTDGGRRVYSGLDTTLYIPRMVDKIFFFQVTCTTDIGSVKTPLVQYDAATGSGLVLTTPGEKKGAGTKSTEFYSELWFIMVMAVVGLILLAIFLSLILQRKIHKEPCIRERPPLVPLQKRMTPLSVYPPGETHVGLADTRLPRSGTPMSIRSSQSVSVLRIPSQSQLSHAYSQSSLHRSVSQLMDMADKKVVTEDSLWETIMGHSSGLYVDEEELMNAIKGFSSVTKEHTAFTDTHL
ncbi:usherin precursor [Mus musculus]|uniref:Usherin n=1 Tax=Mus musculus TaxID=10090 RepID=USH2A_MOUSE|nr:usherin precursor [Mus musculus]Q2QI47.2 RecName: Full=Usherin; AltName: Full=Usher syndrome type IIa protein homolog; AltName: Full=Usher syndrome type-2A protein homolog; Flags: Precursor [Mus musculus]|eukprot:NP_067383.3 usherin precursor [Mus musculus]